MKYVSFENYSNFVAQEHNRKIYEDEQFNKLKKKYENLLDYLGLEERHIPEEIKICKKVVKK